MKVWVLLLCFSMLFLPSCSKKFPNFPILALLLRTGSSNASLGTLSLSANNSNIISGTVLELSSVRLNVTSPTTFQLRNSGNAELQLTGNPSIAIAGDSQSEFTVTNLSSTKLSAGGTASFTLSFAPKSNPSAKTITITIANNSNVPNFQFTVKQSSIPDKYIFVTTSGYRGDQLSGITGADTICGTEKTNNFASLAGTSYKAMIAASTRRACSTANCSGGIGENLNWVLLPSQTYYLSNNSAVFTTNSSSLAIFPFINTLDASTSKRWWTGLLSDWRNSSDNCTNWTSTGVGDFGVGGSTGTTNISNLGISCSGNFYSLVCVEQ
ncbi:MAG: DUF1554 domain-containing protein [Leptospiraceae bacterium]|nr:DUF1554 domain-containing protein [Leptospiraceae bacterium]